jgi:hypothetical protein
MAVASPYALFRASDLLWPAVPTGPLKQASAGPVTAAPTARWGAVIQGELFPAQAVPRQRRSTSRRALP